MGSELTVVVRQGLKKGEVHLEQVSGMVQLVVDSADTLQAIMLGLASLQDGTNESSIKMLGAA